MGPLSSRGVEQDIRQGPQVLPYGNGGRVAIHPGDVRLPVSALLSEPRQDDCGSSFAIEVLFQTDCPLFPQDTMAARQTPLHPSTDEGLAEPWGPGDSAMPTVRESWLLFATKGSLKDLMVTSWTRIPV